MLNPEGVVPGGGGGTWGDEGGVENEGRGESLVTGAAGTGTPLGVTLGGLGESGGTGSVGSCALLGAGMAVVNKARRVKLAMALCAVPFAEPALRVWAIG